VGGANTYSSGTVVTATSTPDSGSTFTSWSGDCNTSGVVTMTANKACIATFTLIPVSSGGGGGGGGGGGSSSSSSSGGGSSSSSSSIIASVPQTLPITTKVTTTPSYVFTTKMTIGTKNLDVKELQKILIEKGYLTGIADGSFGPKTLTAVKKFQSINNLTADGIVGPGTRAFLNKVTTTTTTTPTITTPVITTTPSPKLLKYCRYLSKGNDILEVKKLQQILINKGYLTGTIDGIFGKGTLTAVISFQKAKGLPADGVVGQGTVDALNAS